jgi:ABC-type Fe3+ transport system permease subunit
MKGGKGAHKSARRLHSFLMNSDMSVEENLKAPPIQSMAAARVILLVAMSMGVASGFFSHGRFSLSEGWVATLIVHVIDTLIEPEAEGAGYVTFWIVMMGAAVVYALTLLVAPFSVSLLGRKRSLLTAAKLFVIGLAGFVVGASLLISFIFETHSTPTFWLFLGSLAVHAWGLFLIPRPHPNARQEGTISSV